MNSIISPETKQPSPNPSQTYTPYVLKLTDINTSFVILSLLLLIIKGQVHNPSGSGVNAVSTQAQTTAQKTAQKDTTPQLVENGVVQIAGKVRNKSRGSSMGSVGDVNLTLDSGSNTSSNDAARNITGKKSHAYNDFTNSNKKQGGSGKSKWNGLPAKSGNISTADALLSSAVPKISRDDPIYDSEEDNDRYILVSESDYIMNNSERRDSTDNGVMYPPSSPPRHSYDPTLRRVVYGPLLTFSEFKIRLTTAITEYFDCGDVQELLVCIVEMKCDEFLYEVVKRGISMSMDRGERERELISKLISVGYPTPLTTNFVGKAFERLFENLDDLTIDIPMASTYLTAFLARAVVDEVLPPSFLTDPVVKRLGCDVVAGAVRLLEREHCAVRLEKVWGPADGRPVAELKKCMDQLLKEYLLSRDLSEGLRCVEDMKCPPFHHELIKRGIKCAMDSSSLEKSASDMSYLFQYLFEKDVLSAVQYKRGIERVYTAIEDFRCDCPKADEVLEFFVKEAKGGEKPILASDFEYKK